MRRSTVLSLPLQLVFHVRSKQTGVGGVGEGAAVFHKIMNDVFLFVSTSALGNCVSKNGQSLSLSGALHSGRLRPYPQTLDSAGKAARDKYSSLLTKSINYGQKKVYRTGPCTTKTLHCNKLECLPLSVSFSLA
jgi:hypothetical protein